MRLDLLLAPALSSLIFPMLPLPLLLVPILPVLQQEIWMLANVVVFTASLPASKWWHWDLSPVSRLLFANLVCHLEWLHHSKDSRHNPLACNPGHHLPSLMSLMNQLHLIALLDCSAQHRSTGHTLSAVPSGDLGNQPEENVHEDEPIDETSPSEDDRFAEAIVRGM